MKLAELFIEFVTKGVSEFNAALDKAHSAIDQIKAGADKMGSQLQSAFGAAVATVTGFAVAGVHASAMGDQFGLVLQRLSLTIAGLFRPELQKVLELINRLTQWINSLDPVTKKLIATVAISAAAMLALSKVIPMVLSGIQLLIGGVIELAAAFGVLDVASGGILPLIGALVTVVGGLAVGTETGRNALDELWDVLKGLWESVRPIVEVFTDLAGTVLEILKPIGELVLSFVKLQLAFSAPVFAIFGAALKILLTPTMILWKVIGAILEKMQPLIDQFTKFAAALSGRVTKVIAETVGWLVKMLDVAMKLLGLGGDEKNKADGNRGPLLLKSPGFEGLDATFQRIAAASVNVGIGGKPVEEEQLDELKQIRENTGGTKEAVDRSKPGTIRK